MNAFMKTLLALFASGALLAGCIAVPVDPGPGMYAAPPPVVVAPAMVAFWMLSSPRRRPVPRLAPAE